MREQTTHLDWDELAQLADGRATLDEDGWRHLATCRSCFGAYAEAVQVRGGMIAVPEAFTPPPELIAAGKAIAGGRQPRRGRSPARDKSRPGLPASPRLVLAGVALLILLAALLLVPRLRDHGVDPDMVAPIRLALVETSTAGMILPGAEGSAGFERPVYRSGMPVDAGVLDNSLASLAALYAENESPALAYWLVSGYLAAGRLDHAHAFARKALERFHGEAQLLHLQAIVAYRRSELDMAEALLRRLLARNERDATALFNLGLLLNEKGETGEALRLLKKAVGDDGSLLEMRVQTALDSLGG